MTNRIIKPKIEEKFFKGKVIIIYGARQVGKTTLIKDFQNKYKEESLYLNCDEPDIKATLTDKTSTELKAFFGNKKLILLDEAQNIINIGQTLKLIVDNFSDMQIVATGSSSFELSNKIIEPLTGRKYEFYLYPFSFEELSNKYSSIEQMRLLENRIIFGMYPEVIMGDDPQSETLQSIARSYLYKDVLKFQNIKNPEMLDKLLQALALQLGNEVSYNELADLIGINKDTVMNYIQLLEKAFIIFRLNPFSRNLRNELKKLRKIYFYDTGIRNIIINNLNPLNLRSDVGALWENFIISERLKFLKNHNISKNTSFWRTRQQQEIDSLEDGAGKLEGYQFKWNKNKINIPEKFLEAYPKSTVRIINKDNFFEFII